MRDSLSRHLALTGAVVKRDFLLSWSYRTQFFAGVLSGFLSLALFYYISRLVRVDEFSPEEYFEFVAIGIVIFTVVAATLQIPQMTMRQELVAGTFERILLAPGGATTAVAALLVYPALYAFFTAGTVIVLGAAVFGLDLHWSTVPLALPVSMLSLVAFAPFGVLMLASVALMKKAPPGANYLIAAMSLVAGLYFPVALLPGWIEWVSEVQPFTPAAELLRSTLVGQALTDPAWLSLGKLAVFSLVALPLSVLALKKAMQTSRKRGTVLEY